MNTHTSAQDIISNAQAVRARLWGQARVINVASVAKREAIIEDRRIAALEAEEQRKALAKQEALIERARQEKERKLALCELITKEDGGFSSAIKDAIEEAFVKRDPEPLTPRRMVRDIEADVLALYPGLTPEMIRSKSRKRHLVHARFHIWWAIRNERPDMSFPRIGQIYGGYNYTNVLHGVAKVQKAVDLLRKKLEQRT